MFRPSVGSSTLETRNATASHDLGRSRPKGERVRRGWLTCAFFACENKKDLWTVHRRTRTGASKLARATSSTGWTALSGSRLISVGASVLPDGREYEAEESEEENEP